MDTVYRWRKTTDVARDNAIFELVEGETPVLDVGFTDDGVLEIAFNPSISGRVVDLERFLKLIDEGIALARRDQQ